MTIIRWEPFNNISRIQDRINRMFEESFNTASRLDDELTLCAWKPKVDIYESENATVILADLPGVRKDQIQLEIKDNVLTLSGEREDQDAVPPERYLRKERCRGTFQRAFSVQWPVEPTSVTARFKDGVLEIQIAKPEAEKARQVRISIA